MKISQEKKLRALEKSLEDGLITKDEFEAQKKKFAKDEGEIKPSEEKHASEKEAPEEIKKGSDKILLWSIFAVVAVLAAIIVLFLFFKNANERASTIEELHALNLKGKLDVEHGYVYNQYSFVKLDDLWYTQVQNTGGTEIYSIPLHYGPKELGDVPAAGRLNDSVFNDETNYFITFDPLSANLQYTALAVGEFDQNILKTLGKIPVAACAQNETASCQTRPIITCDNTAMPVVYFKQKSPTQVIYDGNCIVVQGEGLEIVRATDRLLLGFYQIMQPNS